MKALKNKLAGAMIIGLVAGTANAASMSAEDFTHTVSMANLFEIRTSQLALRRSDNSDVKDFAQKMIDDHTAASESLKTAVSEGKVSASSIASTLDAAHQAKLDALENAGGDSFDSQYVDLQEDAHADAVSLFSSYSDDGTNKPLRDFAAKTLPTLESHKSHVEDLSGELSDQQSAE